MLLSTHAKKRSQQRGIPLDLVDFIYRYGEPVKKPGKAFEYRLKKDMANSMIRDLKRMINRIEKARSKVIIVDESGTTIVTTYTRTR